MRTAQGAWCAMSFGTLPRNRPLPFIPLLPTTMRSAPTSFATLRIALAGSPGRACVVNFCAPAREDQRVHRPLRVGAAGGVLAVDRAAVLRIGRDEMYVRAQRPRQLNRLGDRSLGGLGLMGSDDDGGVHGRLRSVTGGRRPVDPDSTRPNYTRVVGTLCGPCQGARTADIAHPIRAHNSAQNVQRIAITGSAERHFGIREPVSLRTALTRQIARSGAVTRRRVRGSTGLASS